MDPDKKKSKGGGAENEAEQGLQTLKITHETDRVLTAHAKKLKLSKRKYANAAISYFAENGLDPTKAATQSFAHVTKTVAQEARSIRVQNVDIGNRLIAIIRTFEKSLYGFMQQQQGGTLNYLENIESGILRHQVSIETNLLSPMVEKLVRTSLEAYNMRVISEHTNLTVTGGKGPGWEAVNAALNEATDKKVVEEMREFIKTHNVPAPTLAPKPTVPAIPQKAPAAPAAGTPAAGPAPK